MKKYSRNIPDGTGDIIFSDTVYVKKAVENFNRVYRKAGFNEIITPTIEHYDVFDFEGQPIPQEMMYRTEDTSGRLLVLRPDNTTPMLRVISTKLKDEPLPVKICYNQNVFRINTDYSGKRSEQIQSGIEIIGTNGIKTDILFIETALQVLESLDLDYKLEIGNAAFYNALIDGLGLCEEEKKSAKAFIGSKSINEFNTGIDISTDENAYDIIRKIPRLFGGAEVLPKAAELAAGNEKALYELAYIEKLYKIFENTSYKDKIIIDLGIVHEIDYYTGIVVNGYIESAGESVLSGGRYDNLLINFGSTIPATGFALNVSMIAKTLASLDKRAGKSVECNPDEIIHYKTEDYTAVSEYIKNNIGKVLELSCFELYEDTFAYAKKRKIKYITEITDGEFRQVRTDI